MSELQAINVAVIGANGYTGSELLRLLFGHSAVRVVSITSRQHEGQKLSAAFPNCFLSSDLVFEALDVPVISKKAQTVFLCLPHHESMEVAAAFLAQGVSVIDLSADFRLQDVSVYEKWYGAHTQKGLLKEAVYGLPELHRSQIVGKKLIASPGCYPTSINLALAPALKNKLIELTGLICDSKSGISGAGRGAKAANLYAEFANDFKAYGVVGHRHTPEIEQELSLLAGETVVVKFTPHLLPISRGILSTVYAKVKSGVSLDTIQNAYEAFYQNESFVSVLPSGGLPQIKAVVGTNQCHIGLAFDERTQLLVIISVIDNLTKGASGQAVQCFNIAHGFSETMGLTSIALFP